MLILRSIRKLYPPPIVLLSNFRPSVFTKIRHYGSPQKRKFIRISELHRRNLLEWQLVSMLDACNDLTQIKQVIAYIFRKGLNQRCYVLTKVIRMLSKLGVSMDFYPRLLFEQVNNPGPFLWSAFVHGYTLQHPLYESFLLYNSMRWEGTGPVSFMFSSLLKACTAALDINAGLQLHAQTIFLGNFDSNLYVGNTLIGMYVKFGLPNCARLVFDEMPDKDVISWTSLIVAYTTSGDMDVACTLFDKFPVKKDLVAWTAMVNGFAQNARPKEALNFFKNMQCLGIKSDKVALIGAISACAQLGAVRFGRWVHNVAENSGFQPSKDVVMGSALIDMYSKCGPIEEAHKVFRSMDEKNVISYSSMILGFAVHGYANEAFQLFDDMLKTDTKPNEVTFIGVLMACSHAGKLEEGWHFFATMEDCHGIKPAPDHYACMVDLLGRKGKLKEALELIKLMSPEPHCGVWGALLGACRIHRNANIAEIAATRLFEIEPHNIGNYLLLSNTYASVRRWGDVLRVRNLLRSKGLKKNPACSWVEVEKGEVHSFFVGDTRHPKSMKIKEALEDLVLKLKTVHGYEPKLDSVIHDVSTEEKVRILMGHSEKLALAFALLNSTDDDGFAITIIKNVRICEDCHSFMCGASQVTGKLILVRDNTRFHHFYNGSCSCKNFW